MGCVTMAEVPPPSRTKWTRLVPFQAFPQKAAQFARQSAESHARSLAVCPAVGDFTETSDFTETPPREEKAALFVRRTKSAASDFFTEMRACGPRSAAPSGAAPARTLNGSPTACPISTGCVNRTRVLIGHVY